MHRPIPAAILVLLCVSFLTFFVTENKRITLFDEGVILVGAERVSGGAVLHRDFYFNYGPAQLYILSFLFRIFSPSVWVERAWDALARSCVVLFVFLLCVRVGSRRAAWLAAFASLILLAHFGFHGYPVFPALASALASTVCLYAVFEKSRSTFWLAAGGLCNGITFLFRYDIGLFAFGAEAILLTAWLLAQSGQTGGASRALFGLTRFLAGFAIIAVPLGAAYLLFGVARDFLFDVVSFSGSYIATRSLPFPGLNVLKRSPSEAAVYLPVIVMAATALAIPFSWRRKKNDPVLWVAALLLALTGVFFAKGFVRVSAIQMALAIISSIALVTLVANRLSTFPRFIRLAVGGALTAAGLCTLIAGFGDLKSGRQNAVAWIGNAGCRASAGIERLGCYTVDESHAAAIRYLERVTTPADPIFVGNGRHDKLFINDIAFYFLAGRVPATKWYQFDPGLQTKAQLQREMVGELSRRCPPFIVLESEWDKMEEANASAVSSGVTILDDYLRTHFTLAARFGSIRILRNISPARQATSRGSRPTNRSRGLVCRAPQPAAR